MAPRSTSHKNAYRWGKLAERIALFYLRLKGYRLLHHNWKCPLGEIDLIMQKGKSLVFIEVKARKDLESAAWALMPYQQNRIRRAALLYTARFRSPPFMRFDTVLLAPWSLPRHLENAF